MSFRGRLFVAFVAALVLSLSLLAFGLRREVERRMVEQYRSRAAAFTGVIRADLDRESSRIAAALGALAGSLVEDNRFRGAAAGRTPDRAWLLDWAQGAMRLTGLDMLQLQAGDGRIVSSGHFRAEFDRVEAELPQAVASAGADGALVEARRPDGPFVALVRTDSIAVGGRRFDLVGGIEVGAAFLERLSRQGEMTVRLELAPATGTGGAALFDGTGDSRRGVASPADDPASGVVVGLDVPALVSAPGGEVRPARGSLVVTHSTAGLDEIRRGAAFWFRAVLGATMVLAVALSAWLSSLVSRPLAELAKKTSRVELERLDVAFARNRTDEIGKLSRLLAAMTDRLRTGAARLREAERRATLGEVARQVNHDIRNGLAPIRNVVRHLDEVAASDPAALPGVFRERTGTLSASVAYLETLAGNYGRLAAPGAREPCDVNRVAREVARAVDEGGRRSVGLRLAEPGPTVLGDPVALRRILENLVWNAMEALEGEPGTVTITTTSPEGNGGGSGGAAESMEPTAPRTPPDAVRITVEDTGRGMDAGELERAFDDFYTTRPTGTGLGLSVVRRLVMDMSGSVRMESEPGAGTRVTVDLPAAPRDGGTR